MFCCRALDRLESLQHPAELLAVHLDPASANKLQTFATGEQGLDVLGAQPLAVERDLHAEVEKGIGTEQRRRQRAHARFDQWPNGTACAPRAWRAHNDTGGLELGHVSQE